MRTARFTSPLSLAPPPEPAFPPLVCPGCGVRLPLVFIGSDAFCIPCWTPERYDAVLRGRK